MSVIFAILLFSVLIFVHELGHFTAAKLSGVRSTNFHVYGSRHLEKTGG